MNPYREKDPSCLVANEELVEIKVQGVEIPVVRRASEAEAAGAVVKAGRHGEAVVVPVPPPVGVVGGLEVVVTILVQQPDPSEAAVGDPDQRIEVRRYSNSWYRGTCCPNPGWTTEGYSRWRAGDPRPRYCSHSSLGTAPPGPPRPCARRS